MFAVTHERSCSDDEYEAKYVFCCVFKWVIDGS